MNVKDWLTSSTYQADFLMMMFMKINRALPLGFLLSGFFLPCFAYSFAGVVITLLFIIIIGLGALMISGELM